jgi:hypothetical protein
MALSNNQEDFETTVPAISRRRSLDDPERAVDWAANESSCLSPSNHEVSDLTKGYAVENYE